LGKGTTDQQQDHFVKEITHRVALKRHTIKFRRRCEGKLDFRARKRLCESPKVLSCCCCLLLLLSMPYCSYFFILQCFWLYVSRKST
jgi:hypothetical protein